MEIAGYFAAVLIGISLGLIGGGGSILTVPVLIYLFGTDPVLSTSYSLFIVGISSFIGVVPKYREGLVNIKTAVVFGIPSITAVLLTRTFVVPHLPATLLSLGNIEISKGLFFITLFSLLMTGAAFSLIKRNNNANPVPNETQVFNYPHIVFQGLTEGFITGLVGAGGGFLIIPALVMLSKLPMKQAIGTSLLIIAAKSLVGFAGDVLQDTGLINWHFLFSITAIAVIGIFIGNTLGKKTDGNKLRKGFGWFVLSMGIYILLKEWLPLLI